MTILMDLSLIGMTSISAMILLSHFTDEAGNKTAYVLISLFFSEIHV